MHVVTFRLENLDLVLFSLLSHGFGGPSLDHSLQHQMQSEASAAGTFRPSPLKVSNTGWPGYCNAAMDCLQSCVAGLCAHLRRRLPFDGEYLRHPGQGCT